MFSLSFSIPSMMLRETAVAGPVSGVSDRAGSVVAAPDTASLAARDALEVRHVSYGYAGAERGTVSALDDVCLTMPPGEVLALVGPSGCGKSTLLRLIAGLERVQSGSIALGGDPVADAHLHLAPESRRIGLVFQDHALFPHLSVADNIGFGVTRMDAAARSRRIATLIGMVGLDGFADRYPHTLSGGQQQRVALARALAPQPRLLLLDEPFSGLDASLRRALGEETHALLKMSGTTAVMVTHDPEEAMTLGDRIAVMRDGRIIQMADAETLYDAPVDAYVATLVGEANRLPGTARGGFVETPLGRFDAPRPGALGPGSPGGADGAVDVLLRPSAFYAVRPDTTSLGPEFQAHVDAVKMIGADTRLKLRPTDAPGLTLGLRLSGRHRLEPGTVHRFGLDARAALVFPAARADT